MTLLFGLFGIAVSMLVIAKSCDFFEESASYLGRNLSDGIKGATINAIGSSIPELMTATIALVFYQDREGFAFGVGTTAGSAIFNSAIIPAFVIFTVALMGKKVSVSRKVILRDGIMLLLAEFVLIKFLGATTLGAYEGGLLIGLYAIYAFILWIVNAMNGKLLEDEEEEFSITTRQAWFQLIISTTAIGVACHFLVKSCYAIGEGLGITTYFVAVILAAAATSVPDTILSIKDARNGDYDDAVSNALGSNIFDICVCIGLPLLIYCLVTGQSIHINAGDGSVAELRILLLIFTAIIFFLLLIGKKVGTFKAFLMISMYGFFVTFIVGRAYQHEWAMAVGSKLQEILHLIV